MARGKTRGSHSISNLLFSLFKISPPLPLRTVVEAGGYGGAQQQGGGGGRKHEAMRIQKQQERYSFWNKATYFFKASDITVVKGSDSAVVEASDSAVVDVK